MEESFLPQRNIAARYQELVAQNAIRHDVQQIALVKQLDALCVLLQRREKISKTSWIGRLLRRKDRALESPRGLYIHGAVGRGKTMLMDLFFDCLPLANKRRAHFNDFMNDVQDLLHHQREKLRHAGAKSADPIPPIAAQLARTARVLCFDELSVTDIADAMILGRLFAALFDEGVTLVATSNVAPDDLYRHGLNRALFLPFIDILKNHVDIFNLDTSTDYRMEKTDRKSVYFFPLSKQITAQMDRAWEEVCEQITAKEDVICSRGHDIIVPHAAEKVARFHFRDLCAKPLAAYDYIALAKRYDTFFIDHVPFFDNSMRNEVKRFILLIDTLYEKRKRVFISAATTPDRLYQYQRVSQTTESFEFERTASRLFEMQSGDYLDEWARNKSKN